VSKFRGYISIVIIDDRYRNPKNSDM